jgi:hypothetical protein
MSERNLRNASFMHDAKSHGLAGGGDSRGHDQRQAADGIQLAGRPWREDIVLAAARFLETALEEWPRRMR